MFHIYEEFEGRLPTQNTSPVEIILFPKTCVRSVLRLSNITISRFRIIVGIDLEEARNKEERLMLQHAKEWLNSGKFEDIPHEKTGATALHVAASKGYIKVME